MRLNRMVASPALFFALLVGGQPQHAFAQVPGNSGKQEPLIPGRQRKPAPNFILTDAKGDTINLSTYKGKVVLLDFWATWCGGCKTEIPWYMEFDAKYKGRGLAVIGVSMDEDGWKSVKPFLALVKDPETGGHTAMKYPVVIGSESLAKQYHLTSMPMTLLIDREGPSLYLTRGWWRRMIGKAKSDLYCNRGEPCGRAAALSVGVKSRGC